MAQSSSGDIHLPFDVIDLIISELASDKDTVSLRACSLTCKAIVPLARKHIFAKVEIGNTKETEGCGKPLANRSTCLLRLLESDSSLADSVRSFKYIEVFGHNDLRWPVLRNATSLEFGFGSYYGPGLHEQPWRDIPESLRASFCNFISSNSFKELSLCNMSFPVSLFHEMPHLTSLTFNSLTFVDVADRQRLAKAKLTRLSFICKTQYQARDLRTLLGGAFDLSQLQELSMELVFYPSYDFADVVGGFISASEQLRSLSFEGES